MSDAPRPQAREGRDVPTVSGKKAVFVVLGLMVAVLVTVVLAALFLAREENARNPPVGHASPEPSARSFV